MQEARTDASDVHVNLIGCNEGMFNKVSCMGEIVVVGGRVLYTNDDVEEK